MKSVILRNQSAVKLCFRIYCFHRSHNNFLRDYQCYNDIELREKLIFLFFFVGAILCLGMSSLFHTVCCHSETVSKLFNKLDYVGISLLTVGSFVPWLYYSFYCEFLPKLVYMIIISVLGIGTITITMMDRFTTAAYRSENF